VDTNAYASIKINAQANVIFQLLANTKHHLLWNTHLSSVSDHIALSKGSTYQTTNFILGKKVTTSNVISEFTQDKVLEISSTGGFIEFRVRYSLVEDKSSTLVQVNSTISSSLSIFPYAAPFLKGTAKNLLESDLAELKLVVETGLSPA